MQDTINFKMPWGKHEGERIQDIPLGYLGWLLEDSDASPRIKSHVRKEIQARIGAVKQAPSIQTIYRQLAMKYHPDHGGTNEAFRAIHEFKELLSK